MHILILHFHTSFLFLLSILFFFFFFFFLMIRRPPRSTLFPYTTSSDLCSIRVHRECAANDRPRHAGRRSGSQRQLWPPVHGGGNARSRVPRPSCESPCRGRSRIRDACRGSGFPC